MPVVEESRLPHFCLVCLLLARSVLQYYNHSTFTFQSMRVWRASKQYPLRIENIFLGCWCAAIDSSLCQGKTSSNRCQGRSTWYQSIKVPRTRYWVPRTRNWAPGIHEVLDSRQTAPLVCGCRRNCSEELMAGDWVSGLCRHRSR